MAKKKDRSSSWIKHTGDGCPVPVGTLIETKRFNGDVIQHRACQGPVLGDDGKPIAQPGARFSAWDFTDGGPMPPKVKAYRILVFDTARERNTAMFRSWLRVTAEPLREDLIAIPSTVRGL